MAERAEVLVDRLAAAIEQVRRETVEACAQLCLVDANAHWKGAEQAESA